MTDARTSAVDVDVVTQQSGDARTSALDVEVVTAYPAAARLSALDFEVVYGRLPGSNRVGQRSFIVNNPYMVTEPTIPEFVGSSGYYNQPENNGSSVPVPAGAVAGDYIFAYFLGYNSGQSGVGVNWSGTGWTQVLFGEGNGATLDVFGKYLQPGETAFTGTRHGNAVGIMAISAYRNVKGIHATKATTTGGNSATLTPPTQWTRGFGQRVLLFNATIAGNDYPTSTTQVGWRRDVNYRRWDRGGAIYSTADPAIWSATQTLYNIGGGNTYGALMLLGEADQAGTLTNNLLNTGARPYYVTGGGIGWSDNLVIPTNANILANDFLIIFTHNVSSSPFVIGREESGWWGLTSYPVDSNNFLQAHGRFLSDSDLGTTVTLQGSIQARGYMVVRNVDKTMPVFKWGERKLANAATFSGVVSGHNTMIIVPHGANSSASTGMDSYSGWDGYIFANRWNPSTGIFWKNVTDNQAVPNMSYDGISSYTFLAELLELRGVSYPWRRYNTSKSQIVLG